MFNKRVRNAIVIKFRNTLESPAIKVTLAIALILSVLMSFFPYVSSKFNASTLKISTNANLNIENSEKVESGSMADIEITLNEGIYEVVVNTQEGYKQYPNILKEINRKNLEYVISENKVSNEALSLISNNNVKTTINKDVSQINDRVSNFMMMMTMIYFLVMSLLVTRIGVQVAFEKGNKVTETILTSLSRIELYFSQVISSMLITILSFILVSIPIVIASKIKDPEITTDFSFMSNKSLSTFVPHLIIVSAALVILSIAIGSYVKNSEDANTMVLLIMLPVLGSYLYYIFKLDIFRGSLNFLNYIPVISVFPVFGGMLKESITQEMSKIILLLDLVFIIIAYHLGKRVFIRNIQK